MKKKKKQKKLRHVMRLLPITVTMLSLLFIIKANEMYLGSRQLREIYSVRDARASEAKKEEEKKSDEKEHAAEGDKKEAKPDDATKAKEGEVVKEGDAKEKEGEPKKEAGHGDDKKEDAKKEEAGHGDEKKDDAAKKEEGGHGEAKKEEGGHGEKKEEGGHGEGSAKPVEEPKTYGTGKSTVKEIEAMKAKDAQPRFTKTELDLLQNLSKRREELDARERDLDIKTKVLDATDKRIADKMNEMKTLQAELSKVLAQYNEKQDTQIKSLVKIYESMKPDEAAAIFNEMEMPILLEVIGKMSERKVAPVLANMSPKKAKDVTQELAERRKKSAAQAAAAGVTPAPAAPAAKP